VRPQQPRSSARHGAALRWGGCARRRQPGASRGLNDTARRLAGRALSQRSALAPVAWLLGG
jgi:hypothetical protein